MNKIYCLLFVVISTFISGCSVGTDDKVTEKDLREAMEKASKEPIVVTDNTEKEIVRCVLEKVRPQTPNQAQSHRAFFNGLCQRDLKKYGIYVEYENAMNLD